MFYYRKIKKDHSLFMGQNVRSHVNKGEADFIPTFLSEIPALFTQNAIDLDVAMIQVSPPDKHGFCSLGTSVDCTRAAIKNAPLIIAQVNKHMPRTHGDSFLHVSHIDYLVQHDESFVFLAIYLLLVYFKGFSRIFIFLIRDVCVKI